MLAITRRGYGQSGKPLRTGAGNELTLFAGSSHAWVKPEYYHDSFCLDLDAEEGAVLGVVQKAPLASTFGDTVSDPAWKHKPSWYQVSTADRMISPVNQERMAARLGARKVISLNASHASLASRPVEVAALILEAARAVAGE